MAMTLSQVPVEPTGRSRRTLRFVLFVVFCGAVAVVFHLGANLGLQAYATRTSREIVTLKRLPTPGGSLVICGGGKLPPEVLDRFVNLAGGSSAKIVVIPTAHAYADTPEVKQALALWKDQPIASVSLFHTRSREKADDKEYVRPLMEATGVWFGGGRQQAITDAYLGTEVERQLKALLDRGGVIGGTSAGAAVMTRIMINSGRTEAKLGEGFGFFPGVVVDQHFLKRNRMKRLIGVVRQHPDLVGLGIDEQTALVVNVRNRRMNVVGNSYVIACVAAGDDQEESEGPSTRLEILKPGDEANIAGLLTRDSDAVIPGLEIDPQTLGAL